jgi:uncharacterized protein YjbI with pentapeptide repeats
MHIPTLAEIECLKARWLTPEGIAAKEALSEVLFGEAERWPEMLECISTVGCPPQRYPGFFSDLRGMDFTGLDLKGAMFAFTDVSHCVFSGADLRDSCFQCSLADWTNFAGCDMTSADLLQIIGIGTDFSFSSLKSTMLMCARLARCSFKGADMTESCVDNCVFTNCDYEGAVLAYNDRSLRYVEVRKTHASPSIV